MNFIKVSCLICSHVLYAHAHLVPLEVHSCSLFFLWPQSGRHSGTGCASIEGLKALQRHISSGQFDLFTFSFRKYTLAVCCSCDVKADFLLVQHVQVLKDLKALQRHISSGHFEIMVQLAGLCVVIYLFSIASSSQSLNCTKDDYVQQILPCDSRTLTRSVVYYLNSSTW